MSEKDKKKSTLKVVSTEPVVNDQAIYEVIAKKAYELYETGRTTRSRPGRLARGGTFGFIQRETGRIGLASLA